MSVHLRPPVKTGPFGPNLPCRGFAKRPPCCATAASNARAHAHAPHRRLVLAHSFRHPCPSGAAPLPFNRTSPTSRHDPRNTRPLRARMRPLTRPKGLSLTATATITARAVITQARPRHRIRVTARPLRPSVVRPMGAHTLAHTRRTESGHSHTRSDGEEYQWAMPISKMRETREGEGREMN
jgi:hypothetical protein